MANQKFMEFYQNFPIVFEYANKQKIKRLLKKTTKIEKIHRKTILYLLALYGTYLYVDSDIFRPINLDEVLVLLSKYDNIKILATTLLIFYKKKGIVTSINVYPDRLYKINPLIINILEYIYQKALEEYNKKLITKSV